MNWLALIGGLFVAWLLGEVFGWHGGGLVVLGGIVGWFISKMHQRLDRTEKRWGEQLAALQAELERLRTEGLPLPTAPSATDADLIHEDPTQLPIEAPVTNTANLAKEQAQAIPAWVPPQAPTPPPVEANHHVNSPTEAPTRAVAEDVIATPLPFVSESGLLRGEVDEQSHRVTSSLGATIWAWFSGGNTIVRVAVLILFIGVAFLLRYAAEHTTVPIELRLAGVALTGPGLVALGRRLLSKRRGYGLTLQGAGIGIIYLTLFAAYRLYHLVPAGLTFTLLALMAAITALLAVNQNALPLAVLGFGGAFLAPVLTSTGQGSHVALFSYMLILNLAIAWIARRQAWKLLNLLGFFFTFTLGGAWGAKAYTAEHFWTTEPFLVGHFLLYLFIAVQYTQQLLTHAEEQSTKHPIPLVDGSLLFGTPIVAFGLQAAMLKDNPLGLAVSAAVMSGIYLFVGRMLWQRAGERMLLLVEGLLALGVIFLALVMPLALDARWTSAAWAIQGVGVLWIGLRQQRWWAAGMGLLLQGAAALAFWNGVAPHPGSTWSTEGEAAVHPVLTPFLNADFFGVVVLAFAGLVSARLLQGRAQTARDDGLPATLVEMLPSLHLMMMGLSVLQLWWGGWFELTAWSPSWRDTAGLASAWSGLLVLGLELSQRRLQWPELRWPARALMLMALLASTAGLLDHVGSISGSWARLTDQWGGLEALILIGLGVWLNRRQHNDRPDPLTPVEAVMLSGYAMVQGMVLLYTTCAHFVARHEGWTPTAAIIPPTLVALFLMARASQSRWPVNQHALLFCRALLQPWLIFLGLWVSAVNAFCDARMAPLPYLPLLNPVDLGHGLVLVYALRLRHLRIHLPQGATSWPTSFNLFGGALGFWWLNAVLIRTLHHWAGTPMWTHGALDSALVQTSMTVLWTLSALVTMLYATRRGSPNTARKLWMLGAALLAVVVLKLFVVDLSNVGTLQRIVSFLAVGGLMLVIGYVSPLPPAVAQAEKDATP